VKFHLSTNRAESFNFLVKRRFVKPRNYGEDDIIFGSSELRTRIENKKSSVWDRRKLAPVGIVSSFV